MSLPVLMLLEKLFDLFGTRISVDHISAHGT